MNRLDETILFKPLTKDNLTGIIDIMVEGLRSRLADRYAEALQSPTRRRSLSSSDGYDPRLRRASAAPVSPEPAWKRCMARAILSGDIAAGSTLTVDVENDELVCR